jgi:predicted dehydrogenase
MATQRVLVIGAGGISNAWFPPIKAEKLNVVGVVDLRPDAAAAQIEKYQLAGARPYTDLAHALRETSADFALDLTIPEAHADVTIACLKAGLHVMGEKPMAASMVQARKMVQTSERTGKLYMVSQSRRWEEKPRTLANTVRAGRIGELTTLNCDFFIGAHFGGFRDEMPSPLILDMAIHHFDLARLISGKDPVSVYAEEFNPHGSWYKGEVAANCLFTFTDNVRFTYRGSWCAEGCHTAWNGDWRAIGIKGTALYERDHDIAGEVIAKPGGFHSTFKPLVPKPANLKFQTMHGSLRAMLSFLRTGKRPETECHDNIKSLAMVFAAIESAKTGKRVAIKI